MYMEWYNGIQGFLAGRVLDFQEVFKGEDLEKLKTTPGAYLGSCRYKLPEDLNDPYIHSFSRNLKSWISDISFISAAMIPWTTVSKPFPLCGKDKQLCPCNW